MNKDIYKNQIKYFKTKLSLLIFMGVVFLVLEVVFFWQEYKISRQELEKKTGIRIEREKMDKLWKELNEKTVKVELDQEILYVENRGKLEPFE